MTEAEKMAKLLEDATLCIDGEWRDEIAVDSAALIREQEAKIKRLSEALKAADTIIWCNSPPREAARWSTSHAEALRDAGVEP